ncbi:hypothetical protein O6H91_02G023900 [Diphasiastrum complanatum]|uniref:Uncharacterized protein n=1 Tax=Diphasiastrum complanatum TaxID=34168 RepID=A0ACC2EDJ1_DIPCM|nr:hypothetical protein O6H91_02G023900 [Diphasiastrum complanatum]
MMGEGDVNMTARRRFPSSAYRTALTQQVQRKLRKALESRSHRLECLRELFTDVALEVDARARDLLYKTDENALESATCKPGRGSKDSLCFYEVLAEHYAQVPDDGKEILPLFVQLWSQSFTSQIFALLFYQWLFEVATEESDGYIRYTTAFVEGANNIFWIDAQSNVRLFFPVYHYVFEIAMTSSHMNKLPVQARRDLVLLLSRFFFFYEPAHRLQDFLDHYPSFSSFGGEAADVFVIELTDQLQKVKVEPVLLHYLRCTKALEGVELQATTSTRLKTALYSFTSPGGPMYPTRPVRHAAWDTLDCLFPVGRLSRHIISLFFRLLHPYYWPVSFWNFVVNGVTAMLEQIYMVIYTICHWLFGSDHEALNI